MKKILVLMILILVLFFSFFCSKGEEEKKTETLPPIKASAQSGEIRRQAINGIPNVYNPSPQVILSPITPEA